MKSMTQADNMTANEVIMINLASLQDALEDLYLKDSDDYCCGDIEFPTLSNRTWSREDDDIVRGYNNFITNIDYKYNHNNFGGDDCLVVIDKIREYMHDGINIKRDVDHVISVSKDVIEKINIDFLVEFYSCQQRYKDGTVCSQCPGIEKMFFDVNIAELVSCYYTLEKMYFIEDPFRTRLNNCDRGIHSMIVDKSERIEEYLNKNKVYCCGFNVIKTREELLFRKHNWECESNIKRIYTQFGTCIEAEQ